jgi:cytoskeletal protein CcmA (bactofilin family)
MIGKKPGLRPEDGEATSIIGEGSAFDGTFEVTGNVRVDGRFTGEIRVSETLVVGKNGMVDANVHTRSAVVAGTIKGNLHAADKITLQSGSRLEGEMITSKLVIEEGVSFQGSCNTAQSAAQAVGAKAAPATPSESKKAAPPGSQPSEAVVEEIAKEQIAK